MSKHFLLFSWLKDHRTPKRFRKTGLRVQIPPLAFDTSRDEVDAERPWHHRQTLAASFPLAIDPRLRKKLFGIDPSSAMMPWRGGKT
jgi:hypothetical protein